MRFRLALVLVMMATVVTLGAGFAGSRAWAQDGPATPTTGVDGEVVVGGQRYALDRAVPVDLTQLEQRADDAGNPFWVKPGGDPLGAVYVQVDTGVERYLPQYLDAPDTSCPSDASTGAGAIEGGGITYLPAGIEPDLTPDQLVQVGSTQDGRTLYAPSAEQPFVELYATSAEGNLVHYVMMQDNGVPATFPQRLVFAGQEFQLTAGETPSTEGLQKVGCALAFPALADSAEATGPFTAVYVQVGDQLVVYRSIGPVETPIVPVETVVPTTAPTEVSPTAVPTEAPTAVPTAVPTEVPTEAPTVPPTAVPTEVPPTAVPTEAPTAVPTQIPPTAVPTEAPTAVPTTAPTEAPTVAPTAAPTQAPPTQAATVAPTEAPTTAPTTAPTVAPTTAPTAAPAESPTPRPTPTPRAYQPPAIVPTLPPNAPPPAAATSAAPTGCTGNPGEIGADGLPANLPQSLQYGGTGYRFTEQVGTEGLGELDRVGCVGAFEAYRSAEDGVLYLTLPSVADTAYRYESTSSFSVAFEVTADPRVLVLQGQGDQPDTRYIAADPLVRSVYSSVTLILYVANAEDTQPDRILGYAVDHDVFGLYVPEGEADAAPEDVQTQAEAMGIHPTLTLGTEPQRYVLVSLWKPFGTTTNGWITLYGPEGEATPDQLVGLDPRRVDLLVFNRQE